MSGRSSIPFPYMTKPKTTPQPEAAEEAHTAIALVSPVERGEPVGAAPTLAGGASASGSSSSNSIAGAAAASSASSPAASASGASSSGASSSSPVEEDSSSAASSSPASSSASSSDYSSSAVSSATSSSSPASSYTSSSPAASALEEGKPAKAKGKASTAAATTGVDLPATPASAKTLDSDITTLPVTPFRKSGLCRCMGWTFAVLAVLGTIVGVLVQQRVIWFVMPQVQYEKGGSSFQLSAVGPAGEVGGVEYATDFYMQIGVKVENPNTYALTFSDVSMALTDFRGAYVGTASHEGMVTVPAKKGKSFILDAEIHTTLPEIMQIAADCEANGMTTEIKAAGSLRAQIVPNVITVPIKMGPYKTSIKCNVRGPDGKPIVGPDGHIHLPDHLQEPAAPVAPTEGEAPTAAAIDQPVGAGDVALEPVPPVAAAGDGAPAPPADGGAPPAEPGKDAPVGGGGGEAAPPAPPAPVQPPAQPPAGNGGGGGGGGGFLQNVFGWGN